MTVLAEANRGELLGASAARSGRREDIQGLRAIAVLAVVIFHAGLALPGGFVGVDVFFVISGYVITRMLCREFAATGGINFYHFYARRFRRLFPALAAVVAATCIASALLLSPLGTQAPVALTGLAALAFSANYAIAKTTGGYFDLPAETNPLLHTWSLAVEEQFYILFPVVLLAFLVSQPKRGAMPVALIGVAAVSIITFSLAWSALGWGSSNWLFGFYSPITRTWEFGLGAAVWLLEYRTRRLPRQMLEGAGWVGLASVLLSFLWINNQTPFPGPWTLLPVLGTALLIVAGGNQTSVLTRLLSSAPMSRIGDWSYSIYLWHWPFIVFAHALFPHNAEAKFIAALLCVGPAIASYRYIEEPIRRGDVKLASLLKIGIPTVGLAGVSASLLWLATANAFWLPQVKSYQADVLPYHAARERGCFADQPLSMDITSQCTWNADAGGPVVYLIGDSNAEHFSEAVIEAGSKIGSPVAITGASACPFVGAYFESRNQDEQWNERCRAFSSRSLDYLTNVSPGVVIIASIDTYYAPDADGVYLLGSTKEDAAVTSGEKLAALSDSLTRTAEKLSTLGHRVILVHTTPNWISEDSWDPFRCSLIGVATGGCDYSMPVERALNRQGAVRAVLENASNTTGAAVLDPWITLCPKSVCSTVLDGAVAYRDASHISVPQSYALADQFARVITHAIKD